MSPRALFILCPIFALVGYLASKASEALSFVILAGLVLYVIHRLSLLLKV